MPYYVYFLFGCDPGTRDNICEYEFETMDELNAFLKGIEAAIGWLDCTQFDSKTEIENYFKDKG